MADFDGASLAFLAWLRNSGAEISENIRLDDLRDRNSGRGVSKLLDTWIVVYFTTATLPSDSG